MVHEHQKNLQDEREHHALEICKLRRELDISREKLKLTEITIIKKNEAIDAVTKQFEMQREKTDLHRTMMEWKLKKIENEKEDFTIKLADKYYSQRLRMRSFLNWHSFILNRHKIKLEKACKKKAEEVCYELATKYEGKTKRLEEELRCAKEETERYRKEMAKNEEYMKKALMRGVCALNIEAMSIFNDSVGITKSDINPGFVSSMETVNELEKLNEAVSKSKLEQNFIYYPDNYPKEQQKVQKKNGGESFIASSDSYSSGSSIESLTAGSVHQKNMELVHKVKSFCENNLSTMNYSSNGKSRFC